MKKAAVLGCLILLLSLLLASSAMADGVSITSVARQENGDVLVQWTDSGNNGPYDVCYLYTGDDGDYPLWTAGSDISSKRYAIDELAPGESYLIVVYDKDGNYDFSEYNEPASIFGGSGSRTRLTVTPRQKIGGRASTIDRFSVSDIQKTLKSKSGDYYGATVKATLPEVSKRLDLVIRMAAKMPDGQVLVFSIGNDYLDRNTDYIYYETISFETLWRIADMAYGEIPTGTYTLSMYLNEDYVGYQTFTVGK